jgi:exodeoxyribonuclease-3
MKIATFNINNINRRIENLLAWLATARPDIVCLQELKAEQANFPEARIARAGYQSCWVGQKAWNGVAVLSRSGTPVVTWTALPGDPSDMQARYLEAAVRGVLIAAIYLPNGNPQPGPKFDYKLKWLSRLAKHAKTLQKADAPVMLAGGYNIAPAPLGSVLN